MVFVIVVVVIVVIIVLNEVARRGNSAVDCASLSLNRDRASERDNELNIPIYPVSWVCLYSGVTDPFVSLYRNSKKIQGKNPVRPKG